MNLPWRKTQPDKLRQIVLANLDRLQRLFNARGKRFEFSRELSTPKLETALWRVLDSTSDSMGMLFPANMACERRIDEIQRALPPMQHPGSGSGQWPQFLQNAR